MTRRAYGLVIPGCWADKGRAAAHELVHMLGAVQRDAPHVTAAGGHCADGFDLMCYDNGAGNGCTTTACPADQRLLLDCGRDDYFNPKPAPGSYLATHWNIAEFGFLDTTVTLPPDPVLTVNASTSEAATGEAVTFTATIDDPRGEVAWSVIPDAPHFPKGRPRPRPRHTSSH